MEQQQSERTEEQMQKMEEEIRRMQERRELLKKRMQKLRPACTTSVHKRISIGIAADDGSLRADT